MKPTRVMYGSHAVAEAVAACRPGVISAYPISPQTHIIERLAYLSANGQLDAEMVRAESEHSAFSTVLGASAVGVRAYTASASQGILLATEVFYTMAGMRFPVVMTVANRTVSTPISIQPDHQDSMAIRDAAVIQLYVESIEEAYATHVQAFRIAEHSEVMLPVMVCMDGWILTHGHEPVSAPTQEEVDGFLPPYSAPVRLDPDHPLSWGVYVDDDLNMEFRWATVQAMEKAGQVIDEVANEYAGRFGPFYGGVIDPYRADDAGIVLLAMGSVAGTMKDCVDGLRDRGENVGLIRIRSFRPFPWREIMAAATNARAFAVLDRSMSPGGQGQIAADLKGYLYGQRRVEIAGFIGGVGGRDISPSSVESMLRRTKEWLDNGEFPPGPIPLGLRTEVL
ncbi:MAG: pyruvate ferredoxin oxidoreductase [Bacillota bacterium]